MGKKKICYKCNEEIDSTEKLVLLGTYNVPDKKTKKLKDYDVYFHFSCWQKYFNECVRDRTKENIQKMQSQAIKVFESVKDKVGFFPGMDKLQSMLTLNLDKSIDNSQKQLNKEDKNGEQKNRKQKQRRNTRKEKK